MQFDCWYKIQDPGFEYPPDPEFEFNDDIDDDGENGGPERDGHNSFGKPI